MSIPDSMKFTITFPTENGFIGRECNNPDCKKYFKIHEATFRDEMYCPYCGDKFLKNELFSQEQLNYARKVAEQEALALLHKEISSMMKKTFSGTKGITYKPGTPYKKTMPIKPREKDVDSELQCPSCESKFQVYGIFGFCPVCRSENILLYDANWEIIKQEICNSDNKERALRHAYSDLVSTFESFCRKKADLNNIEKGRFQNLDHTRKNFKDAIGIDIYGSIEDAQIRKIKVLFEKRHLLEHNQGIISDRYKEQVPEDKCNIGEKVILSIEELDNGAKILKLMLDKLI